LQKFKAHKEQPTQVPISQPIALLFIAAALIFVPSVFKNELVEHYMVLVVRLPVFLV